MVPKNTQKATDWAVGVFKQFLEHHNAVAEKKWPTEILDDADENLCHWLCVFGQKLEKITEKNIQYTTNIVWFATFYQLKTPTRQSG